MPQEYQPIINLDNAYLARCGIFECVLGLVFFFFLDFVEIPHVWVFVVSTGTVLCGVYRLLQYYEQEQDIKEFAVNQYSRITLDDIDKIKQKAGREDELYLGEGFLWGPEHCQAYHEIKRLAHKERIFQERSEAGGFAYIHNVGRSQECAQIHTCPEHTAIIGTTGIGKTRLFELLLAQRIMQGQTVVIIDPKGDKDLLDSIYKICLATHRQDDFCFFSLAHPQHSVAINPLANWATAGEAAARITSIMPQEGNSKPFVDFCYDVLATVIQVMRLSNYDVTIKSLYKYAVLDRGALCAHAKEFLEMDVTDETQKTQLEESLKELEEKVNHDATHYQKMTTSLIPVLKSLTSDNLGALLNPEADALSWSNIITDKKVVYFGLNSMTDVYLASNVGKLIMQDLIAYIGADYAFKEQHECVNLFVDEFYSVAYAGYVDALNKSRAAGLRITLGMQTAADIEAKISDAVRRQIYGNITNKIFLRVLDIAQAEEFVSSLGQCQIPKLSRMRSVSANPNLDSAGKLFSSGYTERIDLTDVDLLPAEILTSLPKGQAVLLTEGNPPFKLRLPLLDTESLPNVSFFKGLLHEHFPKTRISFKRVESADDGYSRQEYWQDDLVVDQN